MKVHKIKILVLALLPMINYGVAAPITESGPINSKSQFTSGRLNNAGTSRKLSKESGLSTKPKTKPVPTISPISAAENTRLNAARKEILVNQMSSQETHPKNGKIRGENKSTPKDDPNKVVLNFENADIQTVIKAISELSGKNFVIDPRVKGTVNIVSDKPISKTDSYKVLESALRMQGFASVEADGVIKVLPEADARTYGMKMEKSVGGALSRQHQLGDQVITKIFVIQHGSATALVNALRPLVAPNNSIGVYPNSNAIIITDYSSNIKRVARIISELTATDEGVATKPVVLSLHNAIAADVAEILNSYMSGGGTSSGGRGGARAAASGGNSDTPTATITVNVNDNSIIIYSPIKTTVQELVNLAEQIDKNAGDNHSNLHVVYLKNGDANHIAEILRDVMKNQENPDITASSSQAKFATEPTSTFSTGSSSGGGGGGGGGSTTSATSSSSRSSSSRSSNNSSNNKPDQPDIVVQADPTTNALIIEAPQAVYKNMRMIIDMLDVRRAQVMIEAMVADINQSQTGSFGIQWLVGAGNNNMGAISIGNYGGDGGNGGSSSLSSLATTAIGATAAAGGNAGAAAGAAGASTGLAIPNEMYVGLVTGTVTVGGQTIPGLSALADMIENNSAGNVLSRPTIITMDNEEARIMVGSNIGVPNGSFTATSGLPGNQTTTITRQDLGIILQIKPLITQSGAIQLDVYQEDSSLDPSVNPNGPNGPTYFERKLRTTLLVDDNQIIALGGMIEDRITIEQDGIPGLSDIPYLGWLFSWQHREHTKSNLVLFLRPVIIKNADGYRALTNQRYNYIMGRENQIQAKANAVLPGINAVNLENQLPFDNHIAPQSSPALNLNKNLPIVDLTNSGRNLDPTKAVKATDTSAAKLTPLKSNQNVGNNN